MSAIILQGNVIDTLKTIEARSVRCVVTSPPYYGLRSYLKDSDPLKEYEIGSEPTPELYIQKLVTVFREVWRVLSDDGSLWLNLGDSYAGSGKGSNSDGTPHPSTLLGKQGTNKGTITGINKPQKAHDIGMKPKDLMMIPARVALALQADGWYLRSEIVWAKPNPMPESVKDRPTRSHEMIYLLTKSEKYFYDYEAILEPADGRNDTVMKGSEKYKNGFAPTDENPQTLAVVGHERWPRTMPKNLQTEPQGQKPRSMHVNRANGEGEPELFEKDGVPARNKRDVWTVTTKPYSEAHFATFPPDLIEPCILAGTSEKGHCPKCGAVWERVTEKPTPPRINRPAPRSKLSNNDSMSAAVRKNGDYMNGPEIAKWREENPTITLGWQPTCECGAEPVPDVVLDPFGGSGTTATVALKHHRKAILCELNNEYIPLINRRLKKIQPVLFPQ